MGIVSDTLIIGLFSALGTGIAVPLITKWLEFKLKKDNMNMEEIKASLTEIQKTVKPTAEGTRSIIRYRLLQELPKHIKNGYISLAEKEDLTFLYESYKNLGGNSIVSDLFEEMRHLPIK